MAFESEFAEILRKKIASSGEDYRVSQPEPPVKKRFFEATYSFWVPTKSIPQLVKTVYPNRTKPKKLQISSVQKASKPNLKPEVHFGILQLEDKNQKALRLLIKLGAKLDENHFSLNHLKKQSRRLAKTYHPDMKGPQACPRKFYISNFCYKKVRFNIENLEKSS